MIDRLRIAQVAPPLEPVPPPAYGGTERIVGELSAELHGRGHAVTTFASGDSGVPGCLVPTVPRALWPAGFTGDPAPWMIATIQTVLARAAEFDLIHSHLEWYSSLLAAASPVPVVTTFHGRMDVPWAAPLLRADRGAHVAISRAQADTQPDARWAAVIHNGLSLAGLPLGRERGDGLAFVGRIAPEKGVVEAIDVALLAGRQLRVAAKAGSTASEREYLDDAFRPALKRAGSNVEWLGELSVDDRNRLFGESAATLMTGGWPEPFGLVAIESLACGTPVIARPVGALPEIVRAGRDGFFGDDVAGLAAMVGRVGELDPAAIRASVIERFSAERMTDEYESLYRKLLEPGPGRPTARAVGPAGGFRARPNIAVATAMPGSFTGAATPGVPVARPGPLRRQGRNEMPSWLAVSPPEGATDEPAPEPSASPAEAPEGGPDPAATGARSAG